MARPKKSYIWDHFTVSGLDESKATCVHCQQSVSRGGKTCKAYNTSNLRKHLNWKHQEQYTALQQAEKDQKLVEELSCKQPTIVEALENVNSYTFDHPRSRKITRLVWEMIAIDNEPFNVVNHVGFKRLMNSLEPRYLKVKERVSCFVKEINHVSLNIFDYHVY